MIGFDWWLLKKTKDNNAHDNPSYGFAIGDPDAEGLPEDYKSLVNLK